MHCRLCAAVLLAALLLAAPPPGAAATAATCPTLPAVLPSGLPVGDLSSNPAFRSKIQTVMRDFLLSFMAGGNGSVPQWTAHDEIIRRLLGANPACPVPHNGFAWTASKACGGAVKVAGVDGIRVKIGITGNKTRCFDARIPTAKTFALGGTVTFFPPTHSITRVRTLTPTQMVPNRNALRASAAYCAALGSQPAPLPHPLKEPAHLLLARHWFGTGKNATCDPGFTIMGAAASDLKLVLVAACEKELTLRGKGGPLGASQWHIKLHASKGCTKGNVTKHRVEIEGVVTFYERINDVTAHTMTNMYPSSPPPPTKVSPRRPPPPVKKSPAPARKSPPPPRRNLLSTQAAPVRAQFQPGQLPAHTRKLLDSVPPPSASETISCQESFDCVFSTLDMASAPKNFPGLVLPVGSQNVNLFSYFTPASFVNTAKYYGGQAFCALAVRGSDLSKAAVLQSGPLSWLNSLSAMGPVTDFINIFSGLPVQANQYYLVGAFATGIPGMDAVPGFPGPVEIAAAINFCIGDYIFGFNGLEVEVTFGPEIPITATMALTTMAYSYRKKLSSDDLGIPNVYWSPSGARTLSMSGDVLATADISVDLGLKGSVAVSINSGNTLLVNTDPKNNGVGTTPDFQALVDMTAGPSIELLDGQLSIDLSALASAELTLYASFLSPSDFVFAFRLIGTLSLTDFLNTVPAMPGVVAKYIGLMYPSATGSVNAYIDQSSWGMLLDFTGNYGTIQSATGAAIAKYTSHFNVLGDVFNQILKYVPGFDTGLSGGFSISGSMTGNGLPIKVSYWSGSTYSSSKLGVYFCDSNSQCPGSSTCNLNICSSFSCPAGTSPNGLLCYAPCRDGYTNVLGVCWKNCPSGWTDAGATCISPGNCPSGQENVAGICYTNCNSGYYSVASVCWSRCSDGYTDIGALCSRPAVTRGKGCCCVSQLKCKGFVKCSWKKSCCDNCDDGFSDTGCTCFRGASTVAKSSYVRPPLGSPFTITAKDSYVMTPSIPSFKIPGTSF